MSSLLPGSPLSSRPTLRPSKREELLDRFHETRRLSVELARALTPEQWRIQSMPDVSPPWWNLGHTSWFFAKNLLEPFTGFTIGRGLEYVLNSYYEAHGARLARNRRGTITRPTNEEVLDFRDRVDTAMERLIENCRKDDFDDIEFLTVTGLQHEQQHQELLVTELKHILSSDPAHLRLPYPLASTGPPVRRPATYRWRPFDGGLVEIGDDGRAWAWDNERPLHRVWLQPYRLANRLVNANEYVEFIADGGYRQPLLWLANGWDFIQSQEVTAPLYWYRHDEEWWVFDLAGDRPVDPEEPVAHLSFYEASAFAEWASQTHARFRGARLPTEQEWEHAAKSLRLSDEHANILEVYRLHPLPADSESRGEVHQLAGDLWEWTSSHYEPYPGYRAFDGALTEYNGKFMDNQRVLRGGSCATPLGHIRASYRNFWHATTRFQFSGVRLATDR